MTTVTTLPTPPSRANPGTFADDADAFLGALPTFGTELNAVASEVNGNASAAVAAAAVKNTDNFLGAWSSGTTYAVGESVSKGNLFWLSKQAGNLNHDPETDNGTWWDSVTGFAPDSSTTTAMSADLTLTASSSRIQAVSSTTYGKSVTLPSALSLFKSVDTFVITNTGDKPIALRNNDGTLLTSIKGGGTAKASLADNSTAAGVWGVEGTHLSELHWKRFNSPVAAGHYNVNSYAESIIKLTATSWIVFTTDGTSFYATHYDVSTDTLGTPTSLGTVASLGSFGRGYVTTSGFLLWCNTQLIAATVTGSTIIPGSAVSFATNGTTYQHPTSFVQLDADLFCGFSWSGTQPQAKAFTVSTNAITAGTTTNIGATVTTAAQIQSAIKRSTSQLIVAIPNSTTVYFRHITVGTDRTITYDSEVSKSGSVQHFLFDIDTDSYGAILTNGTTTSFYNLTVSGVTISSTTGYVIADNSAYWFQTSLYPDKPTALALSSSRVIFHCYLVSSNYYYKKFRIGSMSAIQTSSSDDIAPNSIGSPTPIPQNDVDTFKTVHTTHNNGVGASTTYKNPGIGFLNNTEITANAAVVFDAKIPIQHFTPGQAILINMTAPDRKLILSYYNKSSYSGSANITLYKPDQSVAYSLEQPFIEKSNSTMLVPAVYNDTAVLNMTNFNVLEVAP